MCFQPNSFTVKVAIDHHWNTSKYRTNWCKFLKKISTKENIDTVRIIDSKSYSHDNNCNTSPILELFFCITPRRTWMNRQRLTQTKTNHGTGTVSDQENQTGILNVIWVIPSRIRRTKLVSYANNPCETNHTVASCKGTTTSSSQSWSYFK